MLFAKCLVLFHSMLSHIFSSVPKNFSKKTKLQTFPMLLPPPQSARPWGLLRTAQIDQVAENNTCQSHQISLGFLLFPWTWLLPKLLQFYFQLVDFNKTYAFRLQLLKCCWKSSTAAPKFELVALNSSSWLQDQFDTLKVMSWVCLY